MLNSMQITRRNPVDRVIGAILIDSGKIPVDGIEAVLRLQKEEGLRFGDAAVKLGMVTPQDVQYALARQFDYPYLIEGDEAVSDELVAAYQPYSAQVEALRALRSQLMLRWFTGAEQQKALAVVSPGPGEGRSYLAANLALVFSQLGERTLLIDADMRHPKQHTLFKLSNGSGLSSILSNRSTASEVRRIPAFVDLSVVPGGPPPPNPQELLSRPVFGKFLAVVAHEYDVIIIDTPAAVEYADAQAISVATRGALLVTRKHHTPLRRTGQLWTGLSHYGVAMVGAVLNDF
jgi:receptor protein-tyrosine kinase